MNYISPYVGYHGVEEELGHAHHSGARHFRAHTLPEEPPQPVLRVELARRHARPARARHLQRAQHVHWVAHHGHRERRGAQRQQRRPVHCAKDVTFIAPINHATPRTKNPAELV